METAPHRRSSSDSRLPRERGSESSGSETFRPGPRPSFSEATVSGVEPQQRNPSRVNVYVDGRFAFSLDALLAHELGLREGARIEQEALDDAMHRDEVGKAFDACARLLSYRPRSEAELRQRLARKGFPDEICNEAIERLKRLGYVDDAEFARFWIQNREQFKPMGARRVRAELFQKGLDRDTVKQAIEEQMPDDEHEAAMRVARSRLRSYSRLDDYATFRRRLGGSLARQGFDYETTARVVRDLWKELHEGAEDPEDSE